MDCSAAPATEAPLASLVETLAALRVRSDVVVGVVGSGAGRIRAAIHGESPVYRLRVAEDTPLVEVASRVFPTGRCLVVAREEGAGWSFVVASPAQATEPRGLAAAPPAPKPDPLPTFRPWFGAQAAAGTAAGAFTCVREFGSGDYTIGRVSPFVDVSGEVGAPPVYVFMGLHSYPTYLYGGGVCHVVLVPLYMVEGGLWVGTKTVRVGGYASIGILAVEGGVRVAVTPWPAGGTRLQGFELRGAWLGDRAFLGAVGYTLVWR